MNEAQNDLKSLSATKQQFEQNLYNNNNLYSNHNINLNLLQIQRAEDWASKNEWFGSDQVMTAASLAIDGQLKEEGYSPTDSEYYTEIDRRLKETFPHKFAAEAATVEESS